MTSINLLLASEIEDSLIQPVTFVLFLFQELFDQIKSCSSEDSKLQGMVESLEKMLHDSESRYQISKTMREMISGAITDIPLEESS